MSLFPAISELHQCCLHYFTSQCQTFITSYQSIIYTAPVIQLSETKSVTVLYIKTNLQHYAKSAHCYLAIWSMQPGQNWCWYSIMLQEITQPPMKFVTWSCFWRTLGGPTLPHSGMSNSWANGSSHPELFDSSSILRKHCGHKYKWQH